jgi:hypothetical protein
LDGETYEVVPAAQVPVVSYGNPSMPAPTAVPAQTDAAIAQENLIGSGAATEAYNAAQVHRK